MRFGRGLMAGNVDRVLQETTLWRPYPSDDSGRKEAIEIEPMIDLRSRYDLPYPNFPFADGSAW